MVGIHQPLAQAAAPPIEDRIFLLQEENRPGENMPAFEDEHGTYIMNSKDLRAIQHVQRLMEIGVDCLKIEGRTKSHYYVARTAQAYRRAIDDARAGRAFDMELVDELEKLASRGYTEGFYNRHPSGEYQNYERGISRGDYQQFVGEVTALDEAARELTVSVNNRFAVGDRLELMTPAGNCEFVLGGIRSLDGSPREVAPGNCHVVKLPLPEAAPPLAPDQPRYAVLARYL